MEAQTEAQRQPPDRKGLPSPAAFHELAKTYLEIQTRLWPDLVTQGVLPNPNEPGVVERLATEFEQRFVNSSTDFDGLQSSSSDCTEEGAAYLRYSCDNSNPRSLDQQLRNILERAKRDNVFVPWCNVFADAAVTGTIAARRGYQSTKAAMESLMGPRRLYIDEIGRASRDAIEALRLGKLIESRDKVLVGVTDGFDSRTAQSKMILTMFAMVNEMYVDQLSAKVMREWRTRFGVERTSMDQ